MQPTDLTPAQQARCAKSWDRYARIYDEVEAEHRAEWEDEFGVGSTMLSYVPNESRIMAETVRRIELAQLDDG